MKNVLIALSTTAILAMSSSAMAEVHENTGCGLGSIVIKDQSTVVMQVLAATTNGTSGNQTFGISTGTLNCKAPTKVAMNDQAKKFSADNMDSIAVDIAAGEGESLDTLLTLINVENKTAAAETLKNNFASVYTSSSVTSAQVVDNIIAVL